jgi:hypothetical protein
MHAVRGSGTMGCGVKFCKAGASEHRNPNLRGPAVSRFDRLT